MGVTPATAGLNNAFFIEAGFIVRERKGFYKPTAAAIEYVRTLGFNETQAAAKLKEALRQSWYYGEVKQQLAMGPTTHKQMIEVLAHAAGASVDYTPQLGSVLAWLEYVGLILNTNGYVQLGSGTYRNSRRSRLPPSRNPLTLALDQISPRARGPHRR